MEIKGYKVWFRYEPDFGRTTAILQKGESTAIGSAYLSKGDTFNKRVGRKIALKRALKAAKMSKDERRDFYKELWTKMKK